METSPREITTNQQGIHEDLVDIVNKYKHSQFKKPIAAHTQNSFDAVLEWLQDWHGEIIIDACCGVGESSIVLAQRYPNAKIIGIDKSVARLDKHAHYKLQAKQSLNDNVRVYQADLNDFWRLMAAHHKLATWTISKQCLFYPNPYPKKAQVQKRWHASPSFIAMLDCSTNIEVRSNWLVYLQEFQVALALHGVQCKIAEVCGDPITPFERKYTESGQTCWELQTLAEGEDK
jgi:tRNA G46 methylase TrmB